MDQYGNQQAGRRTDEYGNPIHHQGHGGGGGMFGSGNTTDPSADMMGVGMGGQHQPQRMQHDQQPGRHGGGVLHRSGSGSSSSSESDGEGGRRKKGLKEKIKEKLPGGHTQQQGAAGGYGGTAMGGSAGEYDTHGGQHEKKGMMDKIKEKLPGRH